MTLRVTFGLKYKHKEDHSGHNIVLSRYIDQPDAQPVGRSPILLNVFRNQVQK